MTTAQILLLSAISLATAGCDYGSKSRLDAIGANADDAQQEIHRLKEYASDLEDEVENLKSTASDLEERLEEVERRLGNRDFSR